MATYDWSRCRDISVRQRQGRIDKKKGTIQRFEGKCWPLPETSGGGYRISIKLAHHLPFPEVLRSGAELHDENELLVWLIAHEVAHYLFFTEQILGENAEEECDAFADEMLRGYRG